MGVIRITKHEAPYVMLDKTALKDKRLSFRAKGLHAYLMSKPDDWTIHIEDLAKQSPTEGREAVATGLKELETWGYIRRRRTRDDRGRMSGWDTVVYETPWLATMADEDAQLTGDSPKTALPTSAKPLSVDAPENLDMSESTPKTALPTSVEPRSVPPKTGLPNAANPQLLMNVTTQRKETTKETTDISPSTEQAALTKKGRQKVTSRPPHALAPSDNLIAWQQREFPQYDLTDGIESCLDHYRKQGKEAADYEAAIRNWFRSGHKYGTLKAAVASPPTESSSESQPSGCIGFNWRDGKGRYCDACHATHFPVGR